MPSPVLDSDQLLAVRSDHFSAKGYLVVVSNNIVLQAEVASAPEQNVFGQISFTNTSIGSWTDVREGQAIIISTDPDNYNISTERYRVRKPPTSSIVYINEASISLNIGDIITIINTYDVREKARRLTYVDYDFNYENLQPLVTNMDSAYSALTITGDAQFSFAPIGIAMADGATISSYTWEIPGATYDTGSSSTQNITVTIPETTEWGRLIVTDSNDVSTWFAFSLHIGDPNTDPRFILCHDPVTIEADLVNGYNATTTAYANITLATVMDRTRVAVVVDETYGGDTPPELGNVRFVGYFVKDSSSTRGDAQYGTKKSTEIELRGLKSEAAEVAIFPLAITDSDTPTLWDQMTNPTTERVISHLITRHSTLANLCSIAFPGFVDTPNKWFAGNFDVTDTALMDAVRTAGEEINGDLIISAAGRLAFERNGSFLTASERNALDTVLPSPMNTGDHFELTLERQHEPRVGKVEMGARVFFSNGMPSIGYTALAPAVAYGEGQERVSIPNALLPADDETNGPVNASLRAAYWYAFKNNAITLNGQLTDGWGFMEPSQAQWWPFTINATDTTRGVVITSATRWMLLSVRTVINQNGTQDVTPSWMPETTPGRALILVAVSPSVAYTEQVYVPVRGAYGAFPPAGSINYPTTNPANKQRRDPFSGWQTTPWPANKAAEAGNQQPDAGESIAATNFRYDTNVAMGFLTVLGESYTLQVVGSALIGTGEMNLVYDFTVASGAPEISGDIGVSGYSSAYIAATGWRGDAADPDRNFIELTFDEPTPVVSSSFEWTLASDYTDANWWTGTNLDMDGFGSPTLMTNGQTSASKPINATVTKIRPGFERSGFTTTYIADIVRWTIVLETGGNDLYADAFYSWQLDEDNNIINVQLLSGKGLYLDNSAIGVPPAFNPNHEYTIPFTGTGNAINFKFMDDDYANNQSAVLTLKARGPNAGS